MFNVSDETIKKVSEEYRFQPDTIEKALRILSFLRIFSKHPFLKSCFVLKGGTALNLFFLRLPRLSVDIDLNYIKAIDKKTMLGDRKEIEKVIEKIFLTEGYTPRKTSDEHAGYKYILKYINLNGNTAHIDVDLNYLHRIPIYPIEKRKAKYFEETLRVEFLLLKLEELYASKIVALLVRGEPRDTYDVFQLVRSKIGIDKLALQNAFIFYALLLRKNINELDPANFGRFNKQYYEQRLFPMLRADERPKFEDLRKEVQSFLKYLFNFSNRQKKFIEMFYKGIYSPELLFNNNEPLKKHPAALWKIHHIKKSREK